MAQLKPTQVKASTLLEVIVAMVIILIVFVVATAIYTNVMGSSPSIKQQQGTALAQGLIRQSITEQDWQDSKISRDSILLEKTVVPFKDYPDLVVISVRVSEWGREIGKSRQVVKREEDETE